MPTDFTKLIAESAKLLSKSQFDMFNVNSIRASGAPITFSSYGDPWHIMWYDESFNEKGHLHNLIGPARHRFRLDGSKISEYWIEGRFFTEVDFLLQTAEKITPALCIELLPKCITKREERVITRHLKKFGYNKKARKNIFAQTQLVNMLRRDKKPDKPEPKRHGYFFPKIKTSNINNIKFNSWPSLAKYYDQICQTAIKTGDAIITGTELPKIEEHDTVEIHKQA